MKAVVVREPGGVEVLEINEVPKPEIKEGWTLVNVHGFGVNHSEIFTRQGLSPPVQFPRILGIECVGRIVETTSNSLEVGQEVISIMGEMGRVFDGGYAEYVLLPNEQVYPITSSLSLENLIALPETYYTAFGSFKNLKISETDSILVRGATSGVGIAFAKLVRGKFPQIRLVATSRSETKTKQLIEAGFDDVVLDKDGQLQTRESFSKILELIGPKSIKDSVIHLAEDGIICSCGQLGGVWTLQDFDPIMELQRNVYLTTFYSGNVSQKSLQELIDFVEKYQVDVAPERVFKIDEIQDAHRYLESAHSFGKVIVRVKEKEYD